MIKAVDVELIHSDIMMANAAFYPNVNEPQKPLMMNMAAYHAGQAIEKSLKVLIKDNRPDLYKEISDTHNISLLVLKAELCIDGFVSEHKFIGENSDELSKLNNLRYGKKYIDKDSTFLVLKEAKILYREIEGEMLKRFPNKSKNQRVAVYQLKQKEEIRFKSVEPEEK